MRIKLTGKKDLFSPKVSTYTNSHYGEIVCASGLNRKVVLPKGTENIDIVFTKKPNKNSFTIKLNDYNIGTLKEFKGHLFFDAKILLKHAHRKGYRYVHVEY